MSPHISSLIESSLTVLSSTTAKPNVRGEALQLLGRMCDDGLLADVRFITQPLASAKCSLLQQVTVLCLESQFRVASASLVLVGKLYVARRVSCSSPFLIAVISCFSQVLLFARAPAFCIRQRCFRSRSQPTCVA